MSMAVIAVVGVGLSAASMGVSMSGALDPSQPNLAQSSKQMAEIEAELLPYIKSEEAAAQEGGSIDQTFFTPGQQKEQQKLTSNISSLQDQLQKLQSAPQQPGSHLNTNQGEINRLQTELASNQKQLAGIKGTPIQGNFAGQSTADIQGQIQKQLAQGQLGIEQQFDPQFIQAALNQEQQANPQGVAARAEEQKLIQDQIANPPVSPVSNAMEKQIEAKVAAGSGLTPEEENMLASTVAQSAADRGNTDTTGFENDLTTGLKGTQRELSNAGAGQAWLASGQTPEDIAYRSNQQNMADLANFISGKTPQSQFGSLTAASMGATPLMNNANLSSLPNNAQSLGSSGALNQYQAEFSQSNPWMTGATAALGALNVAGAAGAKPFAP